MSFEPPIEGRPGSFNDIGHEGLPTTGLANSDFDVTVHSVFGTGELHRLQQIVTTDPDSPLDAVLRVANKSLEAKAAGKIRKQGSNPTRTFYPIVLSPGGFVEGSTSLFFDSLRSSLGPTTFNYMMRDLSLGLVRIRADTLVGVL